MAHKLAASEKYPWHVVDNLDFSISVHKTEASAIRTAARKKRLIGKRFPWRTWSVRRKINLTPEVAGNTK